MIFGPSLKSTEKKETFEKTRGYGPFFLSHRAFANHVRSRLLTHFNHLTVGTVDILVTLVCPTGSFDRLESITTR